MCVVSAVIDNYEQWRPDIFKGFEPVHVWATKQEIEELRKEIQMLKDILVKAKLFDDEIGQMDCEKVEKVAILKKIAKALDIDLDGVI